MARKTKTEGRDPANIAAGKRLRRTREILYPDLAQKDFAEAWGIHKVTYNNWEIGEAPIPAAFIKRFRTRHPGIDYNWFWHGEMNTLPEHFRNRITQSGKLTFEESSE